MILMELKKTKIGKATSGNIMLNFLSLNILTRTCENIGIKTRNKEAIILYIIGLFYTDFGKK